MSLRETSERVKRMIEEVRDEVRGTVGNLLGTVPRPLLERVGRRQTILLERPVIPHLLERLRSRRRAGPS